MEGQELAERHIDLRERAGLTQEQEAKMAGVSPTTISGIESGKIARPHLKTLLKIARALGTDVGELRGPGKLAAAQPGRKYLIPRSAVEEMLSPKAPPDLDAADLEDWAAGVDSVAELEPVRRALWLKWRERADYARVVGGGERALADALVAGEKREIIDKRMMELAPTPLATIVMRLDEPTQVIYHRDPTDDERARLRAEYPDAVEVEAKQVAFAY